MRLGHRRTALFGAVLATTFSVSAIAAGSAAPPHEGSRGTPKQREAAAPAHFFPMRAVPEYGDGLDAGRGHEGQDLFAAVGTDLVAVANAEVIDTGNDGGAGNYVSIYDPAANRTYNYFHMLAPAVVDSGARVRAGQKVGDLGCTGSCWGYHLHFEVRAGRGTWGPVLDPVPTLHRLAAEQQARAFYRRLHLF